jgi:hypothetical protein
VKFSQARIELKLEVFDLQNYITKSYATYDNFWNLVDRKKVSFPAYKIHYKISQHRR